MRHKNILIVERVFSEKGKKKILELMCFREQRDDLRQNSWTSVFVRTLITQTNRPKKSLKQITQAFVIFRLCHVPPFLLFSPSCPLSLVPLSHLLRCPLLLPA